MIGPPDVTLYLLYIISFFVGGLVLIWIVVAPRYFYGFHISLGILLIILVIIMVFTSPYTEWKENVIAEIEDTSCEDLPASYKFYNEHSSDLGEKILEKYVFECVEDKELLEMMIEP